MPPRTPAEEAAQLAKYRPGPCRYAVAPALTDLTSRGGVADGEWFANRVIHGVIIHRREPGDGLDDEPVVVLRVLDPSNEWNVRELVAAHNREIRRLAAQPKE